MKTLTGITQSYLDELTREINAAAIEVHRQLGPGLLENVYHRCMEYEFKVRRVNFISELEVPITYKTISINGILRCDFLIENCIILELKAMLEMKPIFDAQLLTYMKILKVPKGILINFNSTRIMGDGQRTLVNEHFFKLKE